MTDTEQILNGILTVEQFPAQHSTSFNQVWLIIKPPLDDTTRHNLQQVEIFLVTFDNFSWVKSWSAKTWVCRCINPQMLSNQYLLAPPGQYLLAPPGESRKALLWKTRPSHMEVPFKRLATRKICELLISFRYREANTIQSNSMTDVLCSDP